MLWLIMNTKADLCGSKDDDPMQRAGVVGRCKVLSMRASGWKMIQFGEGDIEVSNENNLNEYF